MCGIYILGQCLVRLSQLVFAMGVGAILVELALATLFPEVA